jgi:hypothetical protein
MIPPQVERKFVALIPAVCPASAITATLIARPFVIFTAESEANLNMPISTIGITAIRKHLTVPWEKNSRPSTFHMMFDCLSFSAREL